MLEAIVYCGARGTYTYTRRTGETEREDGERENGEGE